MASNQAGAAVKSKKPDTPDPSSKEEEVYNPQVKSKGGLQKNKSSDKIEEKKSKPMPPNPKVAQGKNPRDNVDSDSDSDGNDYAPPKKALSSYNFYSSSMRPKLALEYPEADGKEMMAILGRHWKKATDADKAEFVKKAEKDKSRYERQMEEFEAKGKFYDDDGNVVKIPKKKKRSVSNKKVMQKKKPMKKNK